MSKGGQSISASFVTAKAELQSRQNAAIKSGMGLTAAGVDIGVARRNVESLFTQQQ
jgi:hypothetical protein